MAQKESKSLEDLLELMKRLRDPRDGCPWDLQQTFTTVLPHTLEEAHEVADAVLAGDREHLCEELGDLLFQVVFHAQLASEEGSFDFADVCQGILAKLLRRHPHVFPDGTLQSRRSAAACVDPAEIAANWERIKQEEKRGRSDCEAVTRDASLLDSVSRGLPALKRATALQKKAASVGFDWSEPLQVLAKLREEVDEMEAEIRRSQQDAARLRDELGDLFFVCVNLARFLKQDPEVALISTNRKFEARFSFIEAQLAKSGIPLAEATLTDMEKHWISAKKAGL